MSLLKSLLRTAIPPAAQWKAAAPAFGLAALSAVLLRFAYRPFDFSPIAFVALVPLFWGIRRCRPAMAFWVALLFGAINGYTFTGWLTVVSRFNPWVYAGILPLALWLGAHIAAAVALIVYFGRRLSPTMGVLAGAAVWAGMDYFRMIGRLGLPYGLMGHSMGGWTSVGQLASIGGLPLLTALIVAVNLSLMSALAAFQLRRDMAGAAIRAAVCLGLVAGAHVWGSMTVGRTEAAYADPAGTVPLRVALVQTGIDQETKYNSYASDSDSERQRLQDEMFEKLLDQLDTLEPGQADLIVAPESALTHGFVDVEEAAQRNIYNGVPMRELIDRARDLRTPIMVGGIDNEFRTGEGIATESLFEGLDPSATDGRFNPGNSAYGGLWMIRPEDAELRQAADYRKIYLMPFGETVPYFDLIPGFEQYIVQISAFASGRYIDPLYFQIPRGAVDAPDSVRLGPSICFEDLFPSLHRHWLRYGAQLFVNSTNDAWFDGSAGPEWHMDMARWRSIETRVPMVRCTNSGHTVVIDAAGRVTHELPPVQPGILEAEIRLLREPVVTIYARIGDLFGLLAMLGSLGLWFRLWRSERRPAAREQEPEAHVD